MPDMSELVSLIKQASVEATSAGKPVQLEYGKVTSVSPLKIQINQKLTLGKTQLVLCRNVTDFETTATVEWETEKDSHTHTIHDTWSGGGSASTYEHSHKVTGTKKIKIHNALKVGEKVVMIRQQEGQKYLVLDRVVTAS